MVHSLGNGSREWGFFFSVNSVLSCARWEPLGLSMRGWLVRLGQHRAS